MEGMDATRSLAWLQQETARARSQLGLQLEGKIVPDADDSELVRRLETLVTGRQVRLQGASAIVTGNEINDRHGTGVLLRRLYGEGQGFVSVRSRNDYDGEHAFGEVSACVEHTNPERSQVFYNVIYALGGSRVQRVLCVPYYPSDVLTAIALRDLFNVPLCTYVMDDQNICVAGIPDAWMAELLAKSRLLLAISPELRDAYERKYGHPFSVLPPVVTDAHILEQVQMPDPALLRTRTGAMVGNIWSNRWFAWLRPTVRGSGCTLHWYGCQLRRLQVSAAQLQADRLQLRGYPPEAELVAALRTYPFAVIPSGTLDDNDDRREIARLSLPSRMTFIMAVSGTPFIVLGSRNTGAARFVERFGLGLVADYTPGSFSRAVEQLCDAQVQRQFRARAASLARRFADAGMGEWIWQSLERGEPVDARFEAILPRFDVAASGL